uniref:BACK domain-containing protein n=1 Tax=Pygocentrus nattereri TaxID=42514 RepID=A0AAR2IKP9_PYGNA
MPSAALCRSLHHGRVMKCLAFLLLLPDSLKKPRHPACSHTAKPGKMELQPAGGTAEPGEAEKKRGGSDTDSSETAAVTPVNKQNDDNSVNNNNVNNNNINSDGSSSVQPTLRERYLYSDEIELEADTVLATLYAAKKYLVSPLARACVHFLETGLEARNACVLLWQSRLFDEPELTRRCWEVIDAQAEVALRSEGFCQIDPATLESVLSRDTLNIKEASVLQAVLNWAESECRRRGLNPTPQNKRSALGKALYLLRLPAMSLEEFANGPAHSEILTLEETRDLFLWFTAAKKPALEFPLRARSGLCPQRCRRFQSAAYRSNQWRYRGRCDSVQFAADRRVFLAGIGLYGSSGGRAEYGVRIELKRQGALLAQRITKFVSDGSSSTFPVWFEHPVQVEPDAFYTVSAVLDGNELSYFGQEGMTEVQCGKVTFQFQCSSDSTNGTGVQGGQIPELVFYA